MGDRNGICMRFPDEVFDKLQRVKALWKPKTTMSNYIVYAVEKQLKTDEAKLKQFEEDK